MCSRTRRGPYKQYITDPSRPIPRQTLANWRAKVATVSDVEGLEEDQVQTALHQDDHEEQTCTTNEDCASVAACCSSSPSPSPTPPAPADGDTIVEPLYPGARITEAMGLHLLHTRSGATPWVNTGSTCRCTEGGLPSSTSRL